MKTLLCLFGGIIATLVVLAILMAIPTMLLWNWLIPHISNHTMPEITLFQAWGLNFLCGTLFKSYAPPTKKD